MQKIVIFGATGSIGVSTLDVIKLHPDKFSVFALTANNNATLLYQQCLEFNPSYAYINGADLATTLQHRLLEANSNTQVLCKPEDLAYLAAHPEVDLVMSAIVGSAGLVPTYYAAKNGKKILLANKESLVAGGRIITDTAKLNKAQIIPVDSEHSAIYQALPYGYTSLDEIGVNKIILTASGGPFLNTPYAELCKVTAAQAIKHPNWSMGQKISVDSSTLMNKGLEVIEAYWLFNARPTQIEVIVHPQSIIHSMVEYIDSSIIAQMGAPDMKTPIAYALSAPERITSGSKTLDFTSLQNLTFCDADYIRFPCLKLALNALDENSNVAAIINAANEVAVAKFLTNAHGFYDIPRMIETAIEKFAGTTPSHIEELIALDLEVKQYCTTI
ncbi:MAG: 1-deoxy-D-xylulose-5-phosphate reductoisomerase [Neisseriaceae bacterium]|nr:MAG: 1-deoxy-D-xylulose-5-phosphate reductoisomerase [Neisseriaceae bacterium]